MTDPRTIPAKASARKPYGEYKPLIIYTDGLGLKHTSIVSRAPNSRRTRERGAVYATREEAIAAAQHVIDVRREDAEATYFKWLESPNAKVRASAAAKLEEARLWGSKL